MPTLQELTIRINLYDDMPRLISALKREKVYLSIAKLIIAYTDHSSRSECPFQDMDIFKFASAIREFCPYLKDIDLLCPCGPEDKQRLSFFFLLFIPRIRSFTVHHELEPRALAELYRMESVRIENCVLFGYAQALTLGTRVTSLRAGFEWLFDAQQLAQLADCTRMEVVHITMTNGAESTLSEVVRHMPVLRELDTHTHTQGG